LFEIGFSNHDSVSHRPISELKRLKFAQPADLPIQQAVMVTNLKTAKACSALACALQSMSRCSCCDKHPPYNSSWLLLSEVGRNPSRLIFREQLGR